ncbi:MAG: ribosome biogenesis factor YjgA [bacterium]
MSKHERDEDGYAIRPNKTQQKRELAEFRELAEKLSQLDSGLLEILGLTDKTIQAVLLAAKQKPSSGRKRQIKYVTRLLAEDNLDGVTGYFNRQEAQDQERNRLFHALESWRDRLIEEGDDALQAFLNEYPEADRQQLRSAMMNARKAQQSGKNGGTAKKLFRLLRDVAEPEQ